MVLFWLLCWARCVLVSVKEMAVSFQSLENIQYYGEGAVTEGSVLRPTLGPL